ncbi:MAG: LysR family transcriptional regulator [Gammaproteobacteria bacterium]
MDKLRHMRALVTVAKLGSFSAAARELGVTPGMMSKQVKQLEDELDVRLLNRTTRGVSLTDAGELYVGDVVDILQRIDDAETAVAGQAAAPRGILRLSAPPFFGTHVLTPAIAAFMRDNPGLEVELGLQDDEPDVVASRLDLLFRLGTLPDSSLVARQVGNTSFVLCASPTYVAGRAAPTTLAELKQHNCIVDRSVQADGIWSFVREQRRVPLAVSGTFRSMSTDAVVRAACDGIGIAYVPRYALSAVNERGALMELSLADAAPAALPLYALYASRDHLAPKVEQFLESCMQFIAARSARLGVSSAALERRAHRGAGRRPLADDIAT